jgi:pantetheine-phosphate adenylyltransferase
MTEHSRTAVFPGSFDPLTLGHLDVIERATTLFDRVTVAILVNPAKAPLFDVAEREALIRTACEHLTGVDVEPFEGLLVDYMRRRRARVVIRGIRGATDFDYERQMALMNRQMNADAETVFLVPSPAYSHISSSLVRDIVALGGSVDGLVPGAVVQALATRRAGATTRKA